MLIYVLHFGFPLNLKSYGLNETAGRDGRVCDPLAPSPNSIDEKESEAPSLCRKTLNLCRLLGSNQVCNGPIFYQVVRKGILLFEII